MRDADKQLLADHYLDFYRIAYSILKNEADVEDAVQEALVVTMTRPMVGDPYSYCTVVLKNICIRMKTMNNVILVDGMADIPDTGSDIDSRRLQRVRELLEALPKRLRVILRLHYEKGLSKAQIAKKLGISATMVKRLFDRAQDMLKKQLIEMEINDKDIF